MKKIKILVFLIFPLFLIIFLIFVLPKYFASKPRPSSEVLTEQKESLEETYQQTQQETQQTSGLPDKDQVSGYEPVVRYPGSVMLEYSDISFGGPRTIFIKYGTKADLAEVKNWYVNYLSQEGWKLNFEASTSPERVEANFVKQDVVLQITIIKEDDFTTIDLSYVEQK